MNTIVPGLTDAAINSPQFMNQDESDLIQRRGIFRPTTMPGQMPMGMPMVPPSAGGSDGVVGESLPGSTPDATPPSLPTGMPVAASGGMPPDTERSLFSARPPSGPPAGQQGATDWMGSVPQTEQNLNDLLAQRRAQISRAAEIQTQKPSMFRRILGAGIAGLGSAAAWTPWGQPDVQARQQAEQAGMGIEYGPQSREMAGLKTELAGTTADIESAKEAYQRAFTGQKFSQMELPEAQAREEYYRGMGQWGRGGTPLDREVDKAGLDLMAAKDSGDPNAVAKAQAHYDFAVKMATDIAQAKAGVTKPITNKNELEQIRLQLADAYDRGDQNAIQTLTKKLDTVDPRGAERGDLAQQRADLAQKNADLANERFKFAQDKYAESLNQIDPKIRDTATSTLATLDQVNEIMALLQKDPKLAADNSRGKFFWDTLKYRTGVSPSADPNSVSSKISQLQLTDLLQAATVLRGMGGVRAYRAIQLALQHTPNPWLDSPANMLQKLGTIKENLTTAVNEMNALGKKGVTNIPVPGQQGQGPGGTTIPPTRNIRGLSPSSAPGKMPARPKGVPAGANWNPQTQTWQMGKPQPQPQP